MRAVILFFLMATTVMAACPTTVRPVCGSDGRTYDNACLAKEAGVTFTPVACSGPRDSYGRVVGAMVAQPVKSLAMLKRSAEQAHAQAVTACKTAGAKCDAANDRSKHAKKEYLIGYAVKTEDVLLKIKARTKGYVLSESAKKSFLDKIEDELVKARNNREKAQNLSLDAPASEVVTLNQDMITVVQELKNITKHVQVTRVTEALENRIELFRNVTGIVQQLLNNVTQFKEDYQDDVDEINTIIKDIEQFKSSIPPLIMADDASATSQVRKASVAVHSASTKLKSLISRLNAKIRAHNRRITSS